MKIQYTPVAVPRPRVLVPTGPLRPVSRPILSREPGGGIVPKRTLPEIEPTDQARVMISFHSPCDAPSTTTTSGGGGPTVRNVAVQLLFWGSAWQNNPSPTTARVIGAVSTILSGPYMTGLIQYGVGPGSLQNAGIVTGADPSNPFSDSSVQSMIGSLISQGSIPQASPENLYLVIAPANVGGTQNSVGYHSFFTAGSPNTWPFAWYGWVTHTGTLASLTPTLTHELAEAVSDPDGAGIQVNPRNSSSWNEIGDVCCSTHRVGGVLVQSYWSQRDKACIVPTRAPLAEKPSITCFGVNGDTSRVYYVDTNNNVSELAWDGGWGFGDPLTGSAGATSAPAARAGSALTCFGANGSNSRVYYLKPTVSVNLNSQDVAELYWDNGWGYNILTGDSGKASGAPPPTQNSALTGFGVNGSASRVYYVGGVPELIGNVSDVYELAWNNGWSWSKLTGSGGAANAPSPVADTALTCFAVNGLASRVYYVKPTIESSLNTQDVAELYWDNGWHYDALTGPGGRAAGAPSAAPGSPLCCFGFNGSASRVYYLVNNLSFTNPTLDVYELYWDNGWGWNKLTGSDGKANGAPSASAGGLACFGVKSSDSRVYYLGPNDDVFELYWSNGWAWNKLTGAGGKTPNAPAAAPGTALTCFGVNGSDSRVYYLDAAGHVNELAWLNGGWIFNQLL